MTTLTVNAPNGIAGAGFSFEALGSLDFGHPHVASITSSQAHIDFDGVSATLTGAGLGIGLFGITGVVTGMVLSQGGSAVVTLTGFSITAAAAYSAISNGDISGLATTLFAGDDSQTGSQQADTLSGLAGNDVLSGLAGNDTLEGGVGNDTLRGGAGADHLVGGAGIDSAIYSESAVGVTVDIAAGTGLGGNARGDVLTGIENLYGSAGNDVLSGGATANGLVGGAGNDVLDGRAGKDTLIGGAGADRFVFSSAAHSVVGANADRITDFSHAEGDRIDLHLIDANAAAGANQAFHFIGTGAFTHHAGELHYAIAGGVTTISGDVDGNGTADFSVALTGSVALVAGDFVL
ncbi:Ca2+-binding RTX toxin-like protein [Inquilinus ginsengisoli]|uniref:Ca2+-binding RTX toxin-like protein n=1 Tax=Inquilinus ginsengisoli TaxID=363840 RepID=A0ABU1JIA3_9PROT|nr:calcium-binding protein [Inquilinus ginsengisoli]MDR6288339.1 Ca2+-binding RTX toxin-like protein [Inquilinus ginsengisoli]